MIPYVEILKYNADKSAINPFAVIEPSECWFELSYNENGEFEVYAAATQNALVALQKGNFVAIPHRPYIWIIKSIEYTYNADGARMISAKGFEAKWILKQRIIYTPYQLPTELGQAVYELVNWSLGQGAASYRKVKNFYVRQISLGVQIESTQAPRTDLSEYVLNLLKTNSCGARVVYENGNLYFEARKGADKTGTVIFSQSLDNLISASYFTSDEGLKNFVQVVSTQTENNVTQESVVEYPDTPTEHPSVGIDRNEMTMQSNVSTKYTDESGVEKETPFGGELFKSWQIQEGKNALAENKTIIEFNGEIDLSNSQYVFDEDFTVGDVVKIRDEWFDYQASARITKYTFKQDAGGYGETADYGTL